MATIDDPQDSRLGTARAAMSKVPEITIYFWITKVLTTGMGESASDYFTHTLGRGVAVCLAGACLALSLLLQFAVRRYTVWIYWLAVVMVSVRLIQHSVIDLGWLGRTSLLGVSP
jgi:uncharacterized membrane-anchored protein